MEARVKITRWLMVIIGIPFAHAAVNWLFVWLLVRSGFMPSVWSPEMVTQESAPGLLGVLLVLVVFGFAFDCLAGFLAARLARYRELLIVIPVAFLSEVASIILNGLKPGHTWSSRLFDLSNISDLLFFLLGGFLASRLNKKRSETHEAERA